MSVSDVASEANGWVGDEQIFVALCSTRRLHVLRYLRRNGGEAELRTLVDHVAAGENDKPVDDVRSDERRRVYISLYQTHLPKLHEQGFVEWDEESNRVTLVDDGQLDAYLCDGARHSWAHYYLVLALTSVALVALVGLDVAVFAAVSPLATAVSILSAFFVVALAQRGVGS